jgi:probable aminopeptidase NPEPL1
MKNSVSDRMNAQASCAGHFVEEHLVGEKWDWKKLIDNTATVDQKGLWAHLDIAGTATDGKHGTGAGCALLFEIADKFRC